MNGTKDIIGQAQTGTGKTAAFAIPVIEKIDTKLNQVQAVVIAPTRELAIQVANEIDSLSGSKRISVVQVYGGASMGGQLKQLRA
jgi:ATP-dependent RNA helicase DeaD